MFLCHVHESIHLSDLAKSAPNPTHKQVALSLVYLPTSWDPSSNQIRSTPRSLAGEMFLTGWHPSCECDQPLHPVLVILCFLCNRKGCPHCTALLHHWFYVPLVSILQITFFMAIVQNRHIERPLALNSAFLFVLCPGTRSFTFMLGSGRTFRYMMWWYRGPLLSLGPFVWYWFLCPDLMLFWMQEAMSVLGMHGRPASPAPEKSSQVQSIVCYTESCLVKEKISRTSFFVCLWLNLGSSKDSPWLGISEERFNKGVQFPSWKKYSYAGTLGLWKFGTLWLWTYHCQLKRWPHEYLYTTTTTTSIF
jgi:hypothetical protein